MSSNNDPQYKEQLKEAIAMAKTLHGYLANMNDRNGDERTYFTQKLAGIIIQELIK